jgi:hypothetical protein
MSTRNLCERERGGLEGERRERRLTFLAESDRSEQLGPKREKKRREGYEETGGRRIGTP